MKNARKEILARAIAMRTGKVSTDLSLQSDSNDSNILLDQSRNERILPKKSKRNGTQCEDRLDRIRELGQLRRLQRAGLFKVTAKRICLPQEDS
mgnify:CR=1 FL=1